MEVPQQPPVLPPPPPRIPPNVTPIRIEPPQQQPSAMEKRLALPIKPRPGCKGKRVLLLTNYYKVTIGRAIDDFYHYNVSTYVVTFAFF